MVKTMPSHVRVLLACLAVASLRAPPADAAGAPSLPGYQVNVAIAPLQPKYAPSQVPMFLDTTTTLTNPDGSTFFLPRPVTDQVGLPVNCIAGCGSGGGGGGGGGIGTTTTPNIAGGNATAAAPSYAAGAQPLSMDLSGNLRVSLPSLPPGTNAIGSVSDPATAALQAAQAGAGLKVTGTIADSNNAAYTAWPTISPASGIYTPPAGTRVLSVNVSTAGTITMTDAAGNTKTYPLQVGFQTIPYLPASFTATAIGTFWGDK